MPSLHDVDVLLLLATSLAAKRRPAELSEIVAAIDLIQKNIPSEDKLSEGLARLGAAGLLRGDAAGVALSAPAEQLIAVLPRKGDHAQRLFELRGLANAAQMPAGEAIAVEPDALRQAIAAHRATLATAAKNLLVPKPQPEAAKARPGQRQRKPLPKNKKR